MPRRRFRALSLIALPLMALAILSGCGEGERSATSAGGAAAALAGSVPSGSLVYGEALLRPQGELKDNTLTLLGKVLDKPSSEVAAYLRSEIEKENKGEDFAKVEKLIGDHVAFSITGLGATSDEDPDTIAVFETPDAKALLSQARKESPDARERSQDGVDFLVDEDGTALGIVGEHAVFATTEAVFTKTAAEIGAGRTLDKDKRFTETVGKLGGSSLGLLYVDGKALLGQAERYVKTESDKQALAFVRKSVGDGDLRVAAGLTVPDRRTATLDVAALGMKDDGADDASELLESLPGGAWLALAAGDLGEAAKKSLDQAQELGSVGGQDVAGELKTIERQLGIDLRKDFLDWMGDGGLFVTGTDMASAGGGLVVESEDEAASKKAVATLGRIAGQSGEAAPRKLTIDGAEALAFDAGGLVGVVAAKGDRFFAGVGEAAAKDALGGGAKLSGVEAYKSAKERLDGLDPALFLQFPALAKFVEGLGAANNAEAQQTIAVMRRLESLIAGADDEDGVMRARLVLRTG